MIETDKTIEALKRYLEANGLKLGTKGAQRAEHAFICGIQSTLKEGESLPAFILVSAMTGRSIII